VKNFQLQSDETTSKHKGGTPNHRGGPPHRRFRAFFTEGHPNRTPYAIGTPSET